MCVWSLFIAIFLKKQNSILPFRSRICTPDAIYQSPGLSLRLGFQYLKPSPSPLQALIRARPGSGLNVPGSVGSGLEAQPSTSLILRAYLSNLRSLLPCSQRSSSGSAILLAATKIRCGFFVQTIGACWSFRNHEKYSNIFSIPRNSETCAVEKLKNYWALWRTIVAGRLLVPSHLHLILNQKQQLYKQTMSSPVFVYMKCVHNGF